MASSSLSPLRNYDVFLSFRGEDTRKTIVSHLYGALDGKGINTFKDDKRVEMGDRISDELNSAIIGSSFAVVVLSKNYATSTWCLMELESIMGFYSLGMLKVFPIFYGVDPSDVRHQRGSFSLERHQVPAMADKVHGWREALNQVAGLSGVDSRHCVDEAMMLKRIVEDISSQLVSIRPKTLDDVFGLEAHKEIMTHLLEIESDQQVRMIGLWGMGGIGKTTIARSLYEQLGREYQAHCFIENVDKTCEQVNLGYVLQQFLCDILRIKQVDFRTMEYTKKLARSRLGALKVFIVLDGVEKMEQLDAFAKETSWFGPGSRIIITTRDKELLDPCRVTTIHEIQRLDNEESLKMLKYFAFAGKVPPFDAYEGLAIRASQLAQGLPSALLAFGSYLCGITSIEKWEDALYTLETEPRQSIINVVRSSYNNLDLRSKNIFLKVACLFSGEPLHRVSALLDETQTRITTLADKSLIHLSNDGLIVMHSLIQQVGRELVLEESMYIPRQQKLLWVPLEGYRILISKTGTERIEGMALHICELPRLSSSIDGSTFDQMNNLTFLKFFQHVDETESKLDLISDDYVLPSSLRLLHWDAYPLTTLPSRIPLHFLVELHLRYSNLKCLWNGKPALLNLRMLDVTGSKKLRKLPDFSMAPKFKELITKGCTRLEEIPATFGSVSFLRKLDLSHCDRLMNLVMIIGDVPDLGNHSPGYFHQVAVDFPNFSDTLNYLTDISIQGRLNFWLSNLRGKADHLSFSSELKIPKDLVSKAYKTYEVVPKFYGFKSLDIMRFNYNDAGASFKCYSFSNFPCLTELNLINLNIISIPDNIGLLRQLQKLDLSGNDFKDLPTEMRNLSKMKSLGLSNCRKLEKLPQLTQLETLKLSDCISLQSMEERYASKDNGRTFCLQKLWLDNCKHLRKISDTLSGYTNLTHLDLNGNDMATMPGSIRLLELLTTLCLNDCKKLKSMVQIPLNLTSIYARGCTSLETIYLHVDHSIKHFDLSYCSKLFEVEDLINRFLTRAKDKEVSQLFLCLPGSGVPSYFNIQANSSLPLIWRASESVGFDSCIIIACENPLQLQLSSSSYSCKQEENRSYLINLKPDFFVPSESTSQGEAFPEYHMFIFHVPGKLTSHKFCLETHLELSEEFKSAQVKIISYGVRPIQKTKGDDQEPNISSRDLSEKGKAEGVESVKDNDDESKFKETTYKGDRGQSRTSTLENVIRFFQKKKNNIRKRFTGEGTIRK